MGFKIIKDNVHTKEDNYTLVGNEYNDYEGGKHKFRLLDDDGGIYIYGVSDDDSDFEPLDYFMPMYGCTEIQYRNEVTKEYVIL